MTGGVAIDGDALAVHHNDACPEGSVVQNADVLAWVESHVSESLAVCGRGSDSAYVGDGAAWAIRKKHKPKVCEVRRT